MMEALSYAHAQQRCRIVIIYAYNGAEQRSSYSNAYSGAAVIFSYTAAAGSKSSNAYNGVAVIF